MSPPPLREWGCYFHQGSFLSLSSLSRTAIPIPAGRPSKVCMRPSLLWFRRPLRWHLVDFVLNSTPFNNALEVGGYPLALIHFSAFLLSYVNSFCPSSPVFYCMSSRGHFVCQVFSFRYNSLATPPPSRWWGSRNNGIACRLSRSMQSMQLTIKVDWLTQRLSQKQIAD